ncbi:vWA domain-containing protein [Spirosoma endophyticum]|uniref:Ca-activated chloride channel family protein n=1 Tax=Spirosoma endophyticum TaxID=662367 RepID=A0A1I2AVI9_9BACT|nr:VWA domain-containing protein [Spirosoma endophyticum]SFE47023.1 Ca-activated chloride channel family protein [Spirosoma endophyticum]
MNWLYSFSRTEIIFIGLFIILYTLYIWRTFRLARQLNTSAWGVVPKFFLRGSYLTLLIIALLGPSFGEAEGELITTGHDTFLIVDISRSMDAGDVVPTRLERVKYDIQQLCDTLPAERFGLILAASESFVLSPLTDDQNALKQFMREVHTSVSPTGGTDLCRAIELARQKFITDSSTYRSVKAIVLFSDGENFGSCERSELARLRLAGLPLITVGVGTEAGSSIREGRDFVRDTDRQIVRSSLNRTFLQELARDGRGQYVEADANGRYVNELAGILRSLKGRVIDQHRVAVSTNKYYYFLLAALGLLVLDLIITIRTFRL